MGISQTELFPCGECGNQIAIEVHSSLNFSRQPELLEALLLGTLQLGQCEKCQSYLRVEPEFSVVDLKNNIWIGAFPAASLPHWKNCEDVCKKTFDKSFGPTAPEEIQEMGKTITPRMTFGWAALKEKMMLNQLRFDDLVFESAKAQLIESQAAPAPEEASLRLTGLDPQGFIFRWVHHLNDEYLGEKIQAPLNFVQIQQQSPLKKPDINERLKGGFFIDLYKLNSGH